MGWRSFCGGFAAVAGALALAPSAAADPWDGGRELVTPFEAQLTSIASEIAERPVRVHCNDAGDWSALGAMVGFEADAVWGYVTFTFGASGWVPAEEAELSEAACRHADAFWLGGSSAKPPRTCRLGTRIVRRTEHRVRRVRVRTAARVVVRRQRVPVRVRVAVPVVGLCPGYVDQRLFALQTIAHEAVHLSGVEDEAVAECYGMQFLGWVARRLGASEALAREMARDYWRGYYVKRRPGSAYFDAGCHDGGVLDLAPDRRGWPVPAPGAAGGSGAVLRPSR